MWVRLCRESEESQNRVLLIADTLTLLPQQDAEALGTLLWKREQNNPSAAEGGATDTPALSLDHTPILDTEGLHGDGVALLGEPFPGCNADQQWHDFLSMSGLNDPDANISSPISQDVSLQDAMVTGGVAGGEARRVFRLESSGSDGLVGGGFLDEAVFEQINLLGLEGGVATLEGRDSDSGLSLGSGSHSPASSEESLGQSGFESAAGWSGDAMATGQWVESPLEWAESVRHDHTYTATPLECDRQVKEEVKEEELSEEEEDEDEDEEDLSRDEQRARALRLPVCVRDVVHMPVEDFLRLLGGCGLSDRQVTLLRDIRRRGKNKLAARNCRRRKLEAIGRLEGEVGQLERQRAGLLRERAQNARVRAGLMQRLEHLTERILAQLQLSPAHHRLHFCDGQVSVLPQGHAHRRERRRKDKKR
ncbi:hypothetical protein GJAV_G00106600 [Gymnothorax javanicus]|nr:hypothetical protein GJAV_G00106600 [Gymnothorax javanicus]